MKISPLKWIGLMLLWSVLLAAVAWGSAALWFDGPASRGLAGLLAAIYALTSLSLPLWVRPLRRGFLTAFFLFARRARLVAEHRAFQRARLAGRRRQAARPRKSRATS
jgi:membrane protease YdiL (CAAX protease family)